MARETVIILKDDIDGSEATRTISFTWEGTPYEVDLNEKNASAFEKSVQKYLSVARKAGSRASAPRARGRSRRGAADSRTVREWAASAGYDISPRGRIAAEILEAYQAAH